KDPADGWGRPNSARKPLLLQHFGRGLFRPRHTDCTASALEPEEVCHALPHSLCRVRPAAEERLLLPAVRGGLLLGPLPEPARGPSPGAGAGGTPARAGGAGQGSDLTAPVRRRLARAAARTALLVCPA